MERVSKLAIASSVFITLGFLAIPVCMGVRRTLWRMDIDPTRAETYTLAILCWIIAAVLTLLALMLIKLRSSEKSNVLPAICLAVSVISIAGFAIELPQTENNFIVDRPMTFEGESTELNQTVIVPSLESPLPKNKNTIWCSSFQLAWNELKDDIIKDLILVSENQRTADLLNEAKQSKADLAENEYYAKAGFVSDGIAQTIREEMNLAFPDEPVPSFDDVTDQTAIISYSFLSANVRFKIPYFENDEEFLFTDSSGKTTPITSFGIRPEDDYAYYRMRNQIDILFALRNSNYELTECAVDLCKDSSPNQIVLALVEPKESLAQTISYIEQQHQKAPKGNYTPDFGPNDVLLVPNLFWKITHSFKQFEGKTLGNPDYKGFPIEKAMQVIQFRLDRSGAEVKSEAKIFAKPVPTYYSFNRPFLLYMKKRGAEQPFFAMWIDNPELLEKAVSSEK